MDVKKQLRKTPIQIALLAVLLLAFIILERTEGLGGFSGIVGLIFVATFVGFVVLEIKEGAKSHGWKHEVVDTVLALGFALLLWFGAQFILGTPTPISAVVSCSMLNSLNRGDFVIVQNADVNAYSIGMTTAEFLTLEKGKTSVEYNGTNKEVDGSIYSYCIANYFEDICKNFVKNPENFKETIGPFSYHYEKCTMNTRDGKTFAEPCLTSVEFKGIRYPANFSHDVIVYGAKKGEYFAFFGDIVHRTYFKIDVEGKEYYITRGDNNPIMDNMVYSHAYHKGNTPVAAENEKGRVIASIPFIGYAKLLIAGQLSEPEQCKNLLTYQYVN